MSGPTPETDTFRVGFLERRVSDLLAHANARLEELRTARAQVRELKALVGFLEEGIAQAEAKAHELGIEIDERGEGFGALQARAESWVVDRFGRDVADDHVGRGVRLLEESAELAQAEGVPVEQARKVIEHVYGRPAGDPAREGAQVGFTLLAWAAAADLPLGEIVEAEATRLENKPKAETLASWQRKAEAGIAPDAAGGAS